MQQQLIGNNNKNIENQWKCYVYVFAAPQTSDCYLQTIFAENYERIRSVN